MLQEYNITINKIAKSRKDDVDYNNLGFGKYFTDHMFVALSERW